MSDEPDNLTPPARAWRLGGPMTPAQRKEAKAAFIEGLVRTHCVALACEEANISRDTAYRWREKDTKFAAAWETAVERAKDVARASIYQRGILGWEEPLTSGGQPVYERISMLNDDGTPKLDKQGKPLMRYGALMMVRRWSDSLAALYAKANLPEYKERQQIDLNAHITNMAEQAKADLLAELGAMLADEDDTG